MNKHKKDLFFSVIIPVYNAEKYIEKTIESVLAQKYKEFELILVVDGATDGSYEKCLEYSNKDRRIKIKYQDNKGISAARNVGMMIAKGDYVVFVDHDDIVEDNLLQTINDSAYLYDADIIKYGITSFDIDNRGQQKRINYCYPDKFLLSEEVKAQYIYLLKINADMYIWDAAYKRDFLDTNNLSFDERYRIGGEDTAFNINILKCSPSMLFISQRLYIHYNRPRQSTSLRYISMIDEYVSIKKDNILLCNEVYFNSFESYSARNCYIYFISRIIGSIMRRYKKSLKDTPDIRFQEYMRIIYDIVLWDRINGRLILFYINVPIWRRIIFWAFKHRFFNSILRLYSIT